MHRDRRRRPLPRELTVLDHAEAVLARHRTAELDREREQVLGGMLGSLELGRIVEVDHERRVQVAVAGVPPAAGRKVMPAADLDRAVDRSLQAVDGNHDVLRHLAAALRGDGNRRAVAPAPQRADLLEVGRGVDEYGVLVSDLGQLVVDTGRLRRGPVGVRDHHEPRLGRKLDRERAARRLDRSLVQILDRRRDDAVGEYRLDGGAPGLVVRVERGQGQRRLGRGDHLDPRAR